MHHPLPVYLLECGVSSARLSLPNKNVPRQLRSRRRKVQANAEQREGKDQQKESPIRKAARLLKQQQELQAELAQLSAEAGDLDEEEQQQLRELLNASQPPTSDPRGGIPELQALVQELLTTAQSEGLAQNKLESLRALLDQLQASAVVEEGSGNADRVELPKEVKDFLQEAGVLDAVPWDGRPAQPSYGAFPPPPGGWPGQDESDIAADAEAAVDDLYEDDDEHISGDNVPFVAGEGVAEFLELLEAGRQLPPDPNVEGVTAEGREEFMERMQKLKARYEAQFLDRKDWEISPEEFNALGEDWKPPPPGKSEEPLVPEDIKQVVPAPEMPPEVEQQYQRFQWILFLLRKAHMQASPNAPAEALIAAGLASDNIVYHDAVLELEGKLPWQEYMQRLTRAGGRMEILNLWGDMSADRPHPQFSVFVDTWLNLPYPAWYQEYCSIHAEYDCPPNLGGVAPSGELPPDPDAPMPEFWEPPPPRSPKRQPAAEPSAEATTPVVEQLAAFVRDRSQRPALKGALLPGEGDAYRWLPALRECQAQAARQQATQEDLPSSAYAARRASGQAAGPSNESRPVGAQKSFQGGKHWRGYQWGKHDSAPWEQGSESRRERRVSSTALKWDKPEGCGPEHEAQAFRTYRPHFGSAAAPQAQEAAPPRPLPDSLTRPAALSACILEASGSGESSESLPAEQVGFQLLSFADKPGRRRSAGPTEEEERPPWPEAEEAGQAWRSGAWYSIPLTLCYSIDNSSGQVHIVECQWNAILGHALGMQQDLLDVYMREARLHLPPRFHTLRLKPFSLAAGS